MTPHPHAYPARHTSHPIGIKPGELLDERYGHPTTDQRVHPALPPWTEADQERHRVELLEARKP